MTTTTNTFETLTTGIIVTYNDTQNTDLQFVILDTVSTEFGTKVNVMNLDSRTVEPMNANTVIDGRRWTM